MTNRRQSVDEFLASRGLQTGQPRRYALPDAMWRRGEIFKLPIPQPISAKWSSESAMLSDFPESLTIVEIRLDPERWFQIHEVPGMGEVVLIR